MASTPPLKLSPFQEEKLEYYFKFLEPNKDGYLDKNSVDRLMKKIIAYTGWTEDSAFVSVLREAHEPFFEILFETAMSEDGTGDKVNLHNWFTMWSKMLPGVMAIYNLPVWLRLMPSLLFKIVDRKQQDYLTAEDLETFYRELSGVPADHAQEVAQNAYNQMTDMGRYPLNQASYEQLFANFLIGRTPYGPGRYIFGCFEHKVLPFELIAPAPDTDDDIIMEVHKPDLGRRPSRQLNIM